MPALKDPDHRTFRDPAGSVVLRKDGVFRTVHPAYSSETLRFLKHPLLLRLVADGRVIATEILTLKNINGQTISLDPDTDEPRDVASENPAGTLLLRHPRVPFISYPCEWPPSLWQAAAHLTLNLATDLLQAGFVLKDATPLNVLFQGTTPVFIDILSVEQADPTQTLWLAYGQFVRTFLLPMLAHVQLGWPLYTALMRRDGYEPEEIYPALPWTARLRQPALSAVTLPSLLARRAAANDESTQAQTSSPAPKPPFSRDPELTRHVLRKTFDRLRRQMRRVAPAPRSSTWSGYAATAHHYSEAEHAEKRRFVAETLVRCQPVHVLDVGCNTGVYSRLAAAAGASVVAIDTDLEAVDTLARLVSSATEAQDILPLCVDLSHPTPAAGWENLESSSFLARSEGHFDTVMMLAVLHHLLLNSQIPLERIAALASRITTLNLILEWVPPTDAKFRQLLRGREAIYTHLTEAAFRSAFKERFSVVRELALDNGRIPFHFQKALG